MSAADLCMHQLPLQRLNNAAETLGIPADSLKMKMNIIELKLLSQERFLLTQQAEELDLNMVEMEGEFMIL